jgi:phosphoadenosine phosphosulfate reductase
LKELPLTAWVTKPKIKQGDWKYEYFQTVEQLQEEIKKPFEEKLRRSRQLVKFFAKHDNASISCSFGKDSIVVLHLCLEENPRIKVVFNNTGVEFVETMKLMRTLRDSWNLNLSELRPEKGVTFYTVNDRIIKESLNMDNGKKHSNICCYHIKEKPFTLWARALGVSKNYTGLTALESRNRFWTACQKGQEYYSWKMGVWKVHPILYWTEQEVWNFIKDNRLPINEAYAKYDLDRIGCLPCMSYKTWKPTLSRIAPKLYCYICKRYCKYRGIQDPEYYQEKAEEVEIYA